MKRILSMLAAVVLVPAAVQAEEMSFVTVLSSPLGSFANLETANKATAGNVTFATRGSGTINFYGGKFSTTNPLKIQLMNNTPLRGSSITDMKVITRLALENKGTLKGSRLIADTVTLDDEASGVVYVENEGDGVLYNETAKVKVGKTDSLQVNGGDSKIGAAYDTSWSTPPVGLLGWSNVYQTNPSDGSANTTYKKQYLLTSGTSGGVTETPSTSCTPKIVSDSVSGMCFEKGASTYYDTCDKLVNWGAPSLDSICTGEAKLAKRTCTDLYTIPTSTQCESSSSSPSASDYDMKIEAGGAGWGSCDYFISESTYREWSKLHQCNGQTIAAVNEHECDLQNVDPTKACQSYSGTWTCASVHPATNSDPFGAQYQGFKVQCKEPSSGSSSSPRYAARARTISCCPDLAC